MHHPDQDDPNPDIPKPDIPKPDIPKADYPEIDIPKRGIPNSESYWPLAVQRVYDGMAADYAVRFGSELAEADQSDPDLEFLDAAVRSFPDGYVIDVGCGPAQVSRYLIDHGRTVVAVDFAIAMLAEAARLVPQAGLIAGDLLALPLRPASCAAAVASYSLHHLPKALLGSALAGLSEVLTPGGVLVIITHGGSGDGGSGETGSGETGSGETGSGEDGSGEELLDRPEGQLVLSRYAPDELTGRLRAAGFTPELLRTRPPRAGEYPAEKIRITARRD